MEVLGFCEEELALDELSWWDVRCIATDEHVKRCNDMVRDYRKNVISSLEHSERLDELTKEVIVALGQPQEDRSEDKAVLSTLEWDVMEHNPTEYMERWGKLWGDWKDGKITSSEEFWRVWGGEIWSMFFVQPKREVAISSPVPSQRPTDSHQPMEEHVSLLKRMQKTIAESQNSAPGQITEVVDDLKSEMPLSRQRRHQMAQTLSRVRDTLGRGFKKVSDGITTLFKAVKDGLLPETKGYKCLQENFADFLEGISHLSVLHDLAVKAYSKGLIAKSGKKEAFSSGMSLDVQANNFLELIETRIKRDPKAYDTFLDILRSEPAYEHLVNLAGGT